MNVETLQIFAGWNDTTAQQVSMGAIVFMLPVIIIIFIVGLSSHRKYILWLAALLAIIYLINFAIIAPPLFK